MTTLELSRSRTYPVATTEAFDAVIPMPLENLFCHWFGPIPPVRSTDETAPWGTPGQQRRVELVGTGTMNETLTEVDRPDHFAYRLTGIEGPMAALVSTIEGRWDFDRAGTGTRITWTWTMSLRTAGRAMARPLGWSWNGYARRALEELEYLLIR